MSLWWAWKKTCFRAVWRATLPGVEEERRLFYVAITRAEDHCFLTYAKSRYRYGKMEFGNPSRFLKDIDVRFLKLPQDAGLVRKVMSMPHLSAGRTGRTSFPPCMENVMEELVPGRKSLPRPFPAT